MNACLQVCALAATGLLFTAGCHYTPNAAPAPGLADPYTADVNDPQIVVLSEDLRQWLGFHPPLVIRDLERPLAVEIPVRNLSDDVYLVDSRVIFYDINGRELQPVMGWEMTAIQPKQTARLKGMALDQGAEDWRLEVKWSK